MKLTIATTLAFASILSACQSIDEELPRYRVMSCSELEREIGRWEARQDDARGELFASGLEGVFAETDKEESDADWNETLAQTRLRESRQHLTELRVLRAERRC